MKFCKNKLMLLILFMTIIFVVNIGKTKAITKPYIQKITIESDSEKLVVGSGRVNLYAIVHMSDGTIAKNDENAKVDWHVETIRGEVCKSRIEKTAGYVVDKDSKYYGSYQAVLTAPYGVEFNFYKVFAVSVTAPYIDRDIPILFDYDKNDSTFFVFKKGKVDVGSIGGYPPTVKEEYNYENDTYSIQVPESKYISSHYDFGGWEIGKRKIYAGSVITVPSSSNERIITAQWKGKFKSPELYVTKRKNGLGISWDTIAGANKGYKIYRKTGGKGKYKLIKSYWHYAMTFFEDKKVKKGKAYIYKVKAIKRENGKTFYKTSNWAKMTTGHTNVKYIKFNKKRIAGLPGKVVKLKAKVKRYKRKIATEKVRWYSTDKSVARINKSTGKLKLLKKGKCRIYVLSFNGQKRGNILVEVR